MPESRGVDKLDSRWISGTFLRVIESTMEYLVGTRHGIVKVRTIRRKADITDRWNVDEVKTMEGTPSEPFPGDRPTMKSLRPKMPTMTSCRSPNLLHSKAGRLDLPVGGTT